MSSFVNISLVELSRIETRGLKLKILASIGAELRKLSTYIYY